MEQQHDGNEAGPEALVAAWMKSATDFWRNMTDIDPSMFGMPEKEKDEQKGPAYQAQKSWRTGVKVFQAVASMMSEPENLQDLMKGTEALPEFMVNMTQQTWDGFFSVQKKMMDRAVRIGQHTEAYSFEDLDQELFKSLREIYETEFQKYFNIPQLGLTRFQQERLTQFVDKYNMYQSRLSEFIYVFCVPLEKAYAVLQEKIEEMANEGEISDNYKDYYNMYIKILEGHYMKLLQSPEYVEVMNNTINALVSYKKAREQLFQDVLQNLPVPTNREMDELYKDIYNLKKQVRELSKRLDETK